MAFELPPIIAELTASAAEFQAKLREAQGSVDGLSGATDKLALSQKRAADSSVLQSAGFSKLAKFGEAVTLGLVGVAAIATKLGVDFEESQAKVQASAGLTQKQVEGISNALLGTAGQTEQSANAMEQALAPVAKQFALVDGGTLSAAAAVKDMTAAANLADAGLGTLSGTTADLAGIMTAFRLSSDQAASTSDVLYSTATATGQGIDTLSSALERVRGRMGATAPPLKELSALIVDMTEHGETGRSALSALGGAFTGLITPVGKLSSAQQKIQDEQKKYGLSFETTNGQLRSMQSIIAETEPVIRGMGNAQAIATLQALGFGSSSSKLLDIIRAGPAAFAKAEQTTNRTGSAAFAAALQAKTLGGEVKILASAADDYGVRLGRVLIPKLELVIRDTSKVVEWFDKNKDAAYALEAVIAGVLLAAIGAFIVQGLQKLVTNAKSAYDAIAKLFGLKGGPSVTQPGSTLAEDATTAGDKFAEILRTAGEQLIADATTAGDVIRTAVETGSAVARDELATGGDLARDAEETGAEAARTDLETGGAGARDRMETGAEGARTDLETGAEAARTDLETGAGVGRDALETGGGIARTDLETGADVGRDALETGGEATRTDLETGGAKARDEMETGGGTARDELETGGGVARDEMETGAAAGGKVLGLGTIAFAGIIAGQAAQKIIGGSRFSPQHEEAANLKTALQAFANEIAAGKGSQAVADAQKLNKSGAASAVLGTQLPSSLAGLKAAIQAAGIKAASSADVARTTSATNSVRTKVESGTSGTTAAVRKEGSTAAKSSDIKAVRQAIENGKPLQVTVAPQSITVNLDGKKVAVAVTKQQQKVTRAHGGQAITQRGRPAAITN